jgi:hypothetical protein
MPNVLIHPNSGIIEFNLDTAGDSAIYGLTGGIRMTYQNTGELNITSTHSGNASRFSIDGSKGRLLDIHDTISGSLFAVSDKAGLPVFEVFHDDRVVMGEYNSNALTASGKYAGVGNQIRWSGQNGDPPSTIQGSMWYSSKDAVFRTKLNQSGDSLALGKTFAIFKATDSYGSSGGPSATTGIRNSMRMLEFDQTTQESAIFLSVVPSGICLNSGITARLFWTSTATTNNVLWSIAFEKMITDLDVNSFDTATSATSTANSVAGTFSTGIIACTTIDSIRGGDPYRLCVTRAAANGSDTVAADAQLMLIELQATL